MFRLEELETIAPGVTHLLPSELAALQGFTLVWSLFEAQVLDNNASTGKIMDKVNNINSSIINRDWFEEHLNYFITRYTQDGDTNYRFEHLHLRRNDQPELVRSVLKGERLDPGEQLITCLIIVYRFRNNLFHGLKWTYGLREQQDNFEHSIKLLKKYLEKTIHDI